jgi:GNAT superfamily N-acetyltransferase
MNLTTPSWTETAVPHRKLAVTWFDAWHPVLSDALAEMPEAGTCPHELTELLMRCDSPTTRKVALVKNGNDPVAVIALRRKGRHWEPISHSICPGYWIPAKENWRLASLVALRKDVRIESPQPPPPDRNVWRASSIATYKADLAGDYERYWRESGFIKAVRPARKRCERFELAVDRTDAIEWTLKSWEKRWRDHPAQETLVVNEILAASLYFQERALCHSFLLLDGERPVAGHIFFVHQGSLRSVWTAYDPEYAWHRVGTALLVRVFDWAKSRGFDQIDLAGGHDYKGKAAPAAAEEWTFDVGPTYLRLLKSASQAARSLARGLRESPLLGRIVTTGDHHRSTFALAAGLLEPGLVATI